MEPQDLWVFMDRWLETRYIMTNSMCYPIFRAADGHSEVGQNPKPQSADFSFCLENLVHEVVRPRHTTQCHRQHGATPLWWSQPTTKPSVFLIGAINSTFCGMAKEKMRRVVSAAGWVLFVPPRHHRMRALEWPGTSSSPARNWIIQYWR